MIDRLACLRQFESNRQFKNVRHRRYCTAYSRLDRCSLHCGRFLTCCHGRYIGQTITNTFELCNSALSCVGERITTSTSTVPICRATLGVAQSCFARANPGAGVLRSDESVTYVEICRRPVGMWRSGGQHRCWLSPLTHQLTDTTKIEIDRAGRTARLF